MGNEHQDRGAVEASRTPVETADVTCAFGYSSACSQCIESGGCWGDLSKTGISYDEFLALGDEPAPPSPEAVEPPLTCATCGGSRQRAVYADGESAATNFPRHIGPCPDCKPVESSQEGSETGGEDSGYVRIDDSNGYAVYQRFAPGLQRHVTEWMSLRLHDSISRDAEERALSRCLDEQWDGTDGACPAWWRGDDHGWAVASGRARAAEERATQAEGQREAFRTALREIRKTVISAHSYNERLVAIDGIAFRALSPSTEATPSEEK